MVRIVEPRRDVYPSLMDANADAFAAGHYETAYHALMAALHAAQDLHDAILLDRVCVLARQQQDSLDAAAPEHRLATHSAGEHRRTGVYAQASRQAGAQATIARLRERRNDAAVPSGTGS